MIPRSALHLIPLCDLRKWRQTQEEADERIASPAVPTYQANPHLQESQTQIFKQIFWLSSALGHILSFHSCIVQTTIKENINNTTFPPASCVHSPTFPTFSFLYNMVFPSKGFIFLILLSLGDQENVALFPEVLQRMEKGRGEACLGCSVWTDNSPWSVARGNFPRGEWREHYG